ncbi:MAG: hypothetical protein A3J46_00250 [Candidatus Yanofskybacteria bacterium RIFCSPHIGHO2_02_FULL_41_11]|uniref:Uncharacterized protein n=1 Tax=Candidatus Yanofskybacteria bacterium RIFCSPHIGHO2_02_FULL_41_11 TaxID=1802675 RepID=A0A1F8F7A9_9BACT|nr:MAG: hypothetical protein UW86_C0007G0015 [Microgenomates group bacterium GW2011_GWA1_Microgenomates_45_10]OGN09037.1 MAG: hypothetical protein A3J46_00250 [Candidatus Yanofskybacteria bacterium RIFCSPHIGHO2_02_FULL_41_11]
MIEDTNQRESRRIEKALKAIEIVLDLIEDPTERRRVEKDIRGRLWLIGLCFTNIPNISKNLTLLGVQILNSNIPGNSMDLIDFCGLFS